jgi:uncharacterized Zn-binding protein involved in type VI secretion
MSVSVTVATATTTASLAFHCRADVCVLSLHNHSGGSIVIGAENVTVATGYEIANNGEFTLTIYNEDKLYSVTSSGTKTFDILHTQPNP